MFPYEFVRAFGDTWLLLVKACEGGRVYAGLELTDQESALARTEEKTRTIAHSTAASLIPPHAGPRCATGLAELLTQTALVTVPLRKRGPAADPSFSRRVTVGRAGSADVVLVDDSVSRHHAWLERTEGGEFLVTDAASRNGTFQNGRKLAPMEPVLVAPGDELRFGLVAAVICLPTLFWEAARLGVAGFTT